MMMMMTLHRKQLWDTSAEQERGYNHNIYWIIIHTFNAHIYANIVLLSPSLLYRCEIRFISPPEERPTLHRLTSAENFQWFLDSKS